MVVSGEIGKETWKIVEWRYSLPVGYLTSLNLTFFIWKNENINA